jgi:oxygen-dependent protoporphyrinogen oxidase
MKVLIIGGGVSGLAAAYRLQQALPAADITVLEQLGRPGGTVHTEHEGGFVLESGPNGFLDSKPSTVTLCRDLGLGDQLVPASEAAGKNRYLFTDGRLRPLPASLASFVASDLLTWRGKLSLLWERFRPGRAWGPDESVAAFVHRRAGPEADVLADALVTGIYAGDPTLLSVGASFPRLVEFERTAGSVLKGMARAARQRRRDARKRGEPYQRPGRMWSFRPGLGLLIETLTARLKRPPILGAAVRRVSRRSEGPGWVVYGEGRDAWEADAVLLACPAYQQAALLADLDPALANQAAAIAYNRVTVVGLAYRREDVPGPLDGFGFIVPQRTRAEILGVQWCSSIFPGRAPPGTVLLRAMCGGWHRPDVAAWDDGRLAASLREQLRRIMGISAAPIFFRVIRWERAIPQYHLGHLDRLRILEERAALYPGLFLGGNAYHGVALNDCTEQAGRLAERMSAYLASLTDAKR